jgi:hypothetical protein
MSVRANHDECDDDGDEDEDEYDMLNCSMGMGDFISYVNPTRNPTAVWGREILYLV